MLQDWTPSMISPCSTNWTGLASNLTLQIDGGTGTVMNFKKYLVTHPQLMQAMKWHGDDASLSGSERALALIVHALLGHADRLDAAELNSLSEALDSYAQDVQQREDTAWKIIMQRTRAIKYQGLDQ